MDSNEFSQTRRRLSWGLSIVGFIVILTGVLYFTGSTVGGRVQRFQDRRTYNQVKPNAHAAYPLTVALGLGGLALMIFGSRLRSSEEREA